MNWYYDAGGGERQGPISEPALDDLLSRGAITQDTLVWRQGMTDWAPLRSVRTGAKGSPETERCDACGLFVPVSELIKIGPSNVCAACKPEVLQQLQQGGELPSLDRNGPEWEQKETLGAWNAAVATIKGALTTPSNTFSTMKREGGLTKPFLFHLIVGGIGSFVGLLYNFAFQLALQSQLQLPAFKNLNVPPLTPWIMARSVLIVILAVVLGIFVLAGILHLFLLMCGGAKRPFETTFRVSAYAYGSAAILQVIPICGVYAFIIWAIVALCIGLARAHEIGTGRAVAAVLLPTLLGCIGFVGFMAAAIGAVLAAQGAH